MIRASIMQVRRISRLFLKRKNPLSTTDEKYTLLQIKSTNSHQLIHDVYSRGWLYYQRSGRKKECYLAEFKFTLEKEKMKAFVSGHKVHSSTGFRYLA